MVERVQSEFGHLDIVVCSAGVFHHTPFLKLSEEEWDEVLTVDLKGLFNCTRTAIGSMAERKWGHHPHHGDLRNKSAATNGAYRGR
jgi:3-oxoacyl-[acyl-carrier protein] reductase